MRAKTLAWTASLTFAAGLVLVGVPAAAQENGCKNVCSNNCEAECEYNGSIITCSDWVNRFSNDGDHDGIAADVDNCPCAYNPDQADCDEDGIGDVCDAVNEKWVLVQNLGQCDWDSHETGLEFDVQKIGAYRYRNVCNNTYCSKRYVIDEQSCTYSFWGCGQGTYDCCVCKFGTTICDAADSCGGPACPF